MQKVLRLREILSHASVFANRLGESDFCLRADVTDTGGHPLDGGMSFYLNARRKL